LCVGAGAGGELLPADLHVDTHDDVRSLQRFMHQLVGAVGIKLRRGQLVAQNLHRFASEHRIDRHLVVGRTLRVSRMRQGHTRHAKARKPPYQGPRGACRHPVHGVVRGLSG
jgi:hypothetical protein